MAIFSGKIIDAEYTNVDYSMIKVSYEEEGRILIHHMDADPDHSDFKDLEADGWNIEKIIEATSESKRIQSSAWNIEVNNAAKIIVEEMGLVEKQDEINTTQAYESIVFNEDKDILFKFKLWALETDIFKTATKTQKSSLRKSKSILEGLALINTIINK